MHMYAYTSVYSLDKHFINIDAYLYSYSQLGFRGGSEGKKSPCSAGDPGLIPWSGRSPGI